MRITWLLEDASQIWGGVKVALEDANWLHRRGHEVTVVSRSAAPTWMPLECTFRQVHDFSPDNLPDGDVVMATFWTTLQRAAEAGAGKGIPVHYCQGYEGDTQENAAMREHIEAAYRLPGVHHITISNNLTQLLRERFDIEATQIVYTIDHGVHSPAPARAPSSPLRVGLVGPYQVSWKDLPTGYEACRLAHAAGQPIVLVRATNTDPEPVERDTPFPVEWHEKLDPAAMGDYYRSLDLFLGTSSGAQEGFFLPAIEAMACGVPTVLTDIPCFRSHGDGDGNYNYALFTPPQDAAAMAEAIVIAGRMPDLRDTLRREGLALAARYGQDPHGEALEATLQNLLHAATDASTLRLVAPAAKPAGATASKTPAATAAGANTSQRGTELLEQLLVEAGHAGQRGESDWMLRFVGAAAALAPDDVALQCRLAQCRSACGDCEGALTIYDTLASSGIDDENMHLGRGTVLHAMARFADAAQAFRAAIAVGARTADAFNRLGIVLYQAADVLGARQSFERALILEPDNTDARANLSSLPAA